MSLAPIKAVAFFPRPMGEVACESASKLERDIIQRVLARLWKSLLDFESLNADGAEQKQNSSVARSALNKVPLQRHQMAQPRPSGEGLRSQAGQGVAGHGIDAHIDDVA